MPRPVLVIVGRLRPHEVVLLALSVLSGITNLVAPQPGSPITLLSQPVVYGWAGGMVISGVVGLVGCWWPRRWNVQRGLLLEQAGLVIGAGALLLLLAAISRVLDWHRPWLVTLGTVGFIIAWAAANLGRAVQIHLDLRGIRRGEAS